MLYPELDINTDLILMTLNFQPVRNATPSGFIERLTLF